MLIRRKDGSRLIDTGASLDLSGQNLRDMDFKGGILEGGDLSDSDLRGADFSGAELYGTYLYRADCTECNFAGALLRGVVLDEATLTEVNLEGTRLLRNNMGTSCSLLGADLRDANLATTVFTGCEYDSSTLFPAGFDPVARGMVRKQ
jgi:uncharacterized protein YjbI with pentapeptide repeats